MAPDHQQLPVMCATTTPSTHIERMTKLNIQQQNTNKSLVAQSDFLHHLDPNIYDIGVIQELYLDQCHNSRANHNWYTIYPKEHYTNPASTRLLILINKQLATDTWLQVDPRSSDITAVQLHTVRGKLLIINMYNEGRQQQRMKQAMQLLRARAWCDNAGTSDHHIIWVGDFNLHHTMWDEDRNLHLFTRENLEKSQCLIDAITEFNLQMALPKDIPTLRALS